MSHPTKPSGRSLRAAGAVGLALAASALASLAGASPASAAFTSPLCGGSSIKAEGASFQSAAQNSVFRPYFAGTLCSSVATRPEIQYTGNSSGEGRTALGANGGNRSTTSRFAGSDEPLSPAVKNEINNGKPTAGDEGQIHQIPVALGAIVPLVNFPNGCDVGSVPAVNQTYTGVTPTPTNYTNRVRFTKAQFEAILNGGTDADTWGDLFPNLAAIPGNTAGAGGAAKSDADCQGQQITRVVRFDESGSTYALKNELNKINPARQWASQYNGSDNRLWPNAAQDDGTYCTSQGSAGIKSVVGPNGSNGTPTLVTACKGSGGSLVSKLNQTDGAVSYVDLATAVTNGFRITPTTNAGSRDDDRYYTQLPNGTAGDATFVEPTLQANGFTTDANTGGANCGSFTTITNVPDSTLGDWSNVSATNSASGWGICTLTYDLAFDDNATAFPAPDAAGFASEEKQARTVKDYLTSAVSDVAQAGLPAYNYASVPASIRTIAQQGVARIDWNKAGTGGGGGGNPIVQPTPPGGNGVGTPPAGQPPVAAVSNAFSVPRVALSSKSGSATFSVLTPGAGRIVVASTASVTTKKGKKKKTKKVKLGTITRTVSKGGTVKLTLKPSGSVLSALKKAKSLKVSVKITFTPQGGAPRSSSRTITLKYKAPAKKKASKKRS